MEQFVTGDIPDELWSFVCGTVFFATTTVAPAVKAFVSQVFKSKNKK